MSMRLRTAFLFGLAVITIWFLFLESALLSPFVLAAIFAYIFNPVVDFFFHKIRLPRLISIIIIYLLILALLVAFSIFITGKVVSEFSEFQKVVTTFLSVTKSQIATLPIYLRSPVEEALLSIDQAKIVSSSFVFRFFPEAISKIIGLLIFLFSGFYFLKEGKKMIGNTLQFVPDRYQPDVKILLSRINSVFGRYLRGQLLMVSLIALILFISLSILGVRFALLLAIFSGIAEIIPFIGPITAGAIAMLVVLTTGEVSFGLTPFQGAALVALIYFLVRQIQDYLIAPQIMGKIVGLHPLLILFAVLAGGRIGGLLGVILAVPIAAAIRIILEFSLDKINQTQPDSEI